MFITFFAFIVLIVINVYGCRLEASKNQLSGLQLIYINMDSATDRNNLFLDQFNCSDVTRISGVNASSNSELSRILLNGLETVPGLKEVFKEGDMFAESENGRYPVQQYNKVFFSTLGCLLSHFKAAQTLLEMNRANPDIQFALILEDDVTDELIPLWPENDGKSLILDILLALPSNWTLVQLSVLMDQRRFELIRSSIEDYNMFVMLPNVAFPSAGAYLLSVTGALELLKLGRASSPTDRLDLSDMQCVNADICFHPVLNDRYVYFPPLFLHREPGGIQKSSISASHMNDLLIEQFIVNSARNASIYWMFDSYLMKHSIKPISMETVLFSESEDSLDALLAASGMKTPHHSLAHPLLRDYSDVLIIPPSAPLCTIGDQEIHLSKFFDVGIIYLANSEEFEQLKSNVMLVPEFIQSYHGTHLFKPHQLLCLRLNIVRKVEIIDARVSANVKATLLLQRPRTSIYTVEYSQLFDKITTLSPMEVLRMFSSFGIVYDGVLSVVNLELLSVYVDAPSTGCTFTDYRSCAITLFENSAFFNEYIRLRISAGKNNDKLFQLSVELLLLFLDYFEHLSQLLTHLKLSLFLRALDAPYALVIDGDGEVTVSDYEDDINPLCNDFLRLCFTEQFSMSNLIHNSLDKSGYYPLSLTTLVRSCADVKTINQKENMLTVESKDILVNDTLIVDDSLLDLLSLSGVLSTNNSSVSDILHTYENISQVNLSTLHGSTNSTSTSNGTGSWNGLDIRPGDEFPRYPYKFEFFTPENQGDNVQINEVEEAQLDIFVLTRRGASELLYRYYKSTAEKFQIVDSSVQSSVVLSRELGVKRRLEYDIFNPEISKCN